ncbi:hypothetical protein TSUD_188900 [Trifolium subterraneum]|uniref:Uncharacterized protein n=1 Tax=Trifolium subterraneum TaxID=3900 RepID=A0A2Z6NYR4_TRISU|nr:hypothetical protein TSUD_188900 [Trifolium subterraneum]
MAAILDLGSHFGFRYVEILLHCATLFVGFAVSGLLFVEFEELERLLSRFPHSRYLVFSRPVLGAQGGKRWLVGQVVELGKWLVDGHVGVRLGSR